MKKEKLTPEEKELMMAGRDGDYLLSLTRKAIFEDLPRVKSVEHLYFNGVNTVFDESDPMGFEWGDFKFDVTSKKRRRIDPIYQDYGCISGRLHLITTDEEMLDYLRLPNMEMAAAARQVEAYAKENRNAENTCDAVLRLMTASYVLMQNVALKVGAKMMPIEKGRCMNDLLLHYILELGFAYYKYMNNDQRMIVDAMEKDMTEVAPTRIMVKPQTVTYLKLSRKIERLRLYTNHKFTNYNLTCDVVTWVHEKFTECHKRVYENLRNPERAEYMDKFIIMRLQEINISLMGLLLLIDQKKQMFADGEGTPMEKLRSYAMVMLFEVTDEMGDPLLDAEELTVFLSVYEYLLKDAENTGDEIEDNVDNYIPVLRQAVAKSEGNRDLMLALRYAIYKGYRMYLNYVDTTLDKNPESAIRKESLMYVERGFVYMINQLFGLNMKDTSIRKEVSRFYTSMEKFGVLHVDLELEMHDFTRW